MNVQPSPEVVNVDPPLATAASGATTASGAAPQPEAPPPGEVFNARDFLGESIDRARTCPDCGHSRGSLAHRSACNERTSA